MAASAQSISQPGRKIDANALRTNQVLIVGLTVLAFVLGTPAGAVIIAFVAASLAIGAARPGTGPFQQLHRRVLVPRGIVKAAPRDEDPAPHRFAQTVGASFLAVSAVLLFADFSTAGWVLAWIVVALALVNLLFNFCAGCFMFVQLRKVGLFA